MGITTATMATKATTEITMATMATRATTVDGTIGTRTMAVTRAEDVELLKKTKVRIMVIRKMVSGAITEIKRATTTWTTVIKTTLVAMLTWEVTCNHVCRCACRLIR